MITINLPEDRVYRIINSDNYIWEVDEEARLIVKTKDDGSIVATYNTGCWLSIIKIPADVQPLTN